MIRGSASRTRLTLMRYGPIFQATSRREVFRKPAEYMVLDHTKYRLCQNNNRIPALVCSTGPDGRINMGLRHGDPSQTPGVERSGTTELSNHILLPGCQCLASSTLPPQITRLRKFPSTFRCKSSGSTGACIDGPRIIGTQARKPFAHVYFRISGASVSGSLVSKGSLVRIIVCAFALSTQAYLFVAGRAPLRAVDVNQHQRKLVGCLLLR